MCENVLIKHGSHKNIESTVSIAVFVGMCSGSLEKFDNFIKLILRLSCATC